MAFDSSLLRVDAKDKLQPHHQPFPAGFQVSAVELLASVSSLALASDAIEFLPWHLQSKLGLDVRHSY
eukprot:403168-Amphidinium_carterae.1